MGSGVNSEDVRITAEVRSMKDLCSGHGLLITYNEMVGIIHRIDIHLLFFLVIDRNRFPDQDELVALVSLEFHQISEIVGVKPITC